MRESRFWLSILLHTYEPHNPCALANGYVPWWLPGCNSANAETTEPPTTNHEPPWPSPALKCGYTNAHLSSSLCVWVRACAWGFLMNQHSWTPSCKPTKNKTKKKESKFEKREKPQRLNPNKPTTIYAHVHFWQRFWFWKQKLLSHSHAVNSECFLSERANAAYTQSFVRLLKLETFVGSMGNSSAGAGLNLIALKLHCIKNAL